MIESKKPKMICLDYDDVVVDFLGHLIHLYNCYHNTCITLNDLTSWNFKDINFTDYNNNQIRGKDLEKFFKEYEGEGLYTTIPAFKEAKLAIRILKSLGYMIAIITSRKDEFKKQTILNSILNDIKVDKFFFEQDKIKRLNSLRRSYNLVAFVDDKATTIEAVDNECKVGRLYILDKPHNRKFQFTSSDIRRISDIMEIIRDLEA